MERRGWPTLNEQVRFSYGTIQQWGHRREEYTRRRAAEPYLPDVSQYSELPLDGLEQNGVAQR